MPLSVRCVLTLLPFSKQPNGARACQWFLKNNIYVRKEKNNIKRDNIRIHSCLCHFRFVNELLCCIRTSTFNMNSVQSSVLVTLTRKQSSGRYVHSSANRNTEEVILKEMTSRASTPRVLICLTAFWMGLDVKGVERGHDDAPHTHLRNKYKWWEEQPEISVSRDMLCFFIVPLKEQKMRWKLSVHHKVVWVVKLGNILKQKHLSYPYTIVVVYVVVLSVVALVLCAQQQNTN